MYYVICIFHRSDNLALSDDIFTASGTCNLYCVNFMHKLIKKYFLLKWKFLWNMALLKKNETIENLHFVLQYFSMSLKLLALSFISNAIDSDSMIMC